jgi:hypothetical protein
MARFGMTSASRKMPDFMGKFARVKLKLSSHAADVKNGEIPEFNAQDCGSVAIWPLAATTGLLLND